MGGSLKEEFFVHGESDGATAQGTITVTITGENDKPTLELKDANGDPLETGPIQVEDWDPVKGEAHGEDVDNIWKSDVESELRYSVSNSENLGSEPGDGGETGEQASVLQTIKGTYGYLTIDSVTGKYTYVVDPVSENYQGLKENGPGEETFTIWVKDPHGDYAKQEISFEVSWAGGTGSGESIMLGSTTAVAVTEDDGDYDVTLPPSVASTFENLVDSDGEFVQIPADQIWLLDNGGKGEPDATDGKTHVVKTDYGSLILEQQDGQWGYRFVLNNSSDIVQSLDEDDSIEKTFYVSAGTNQVPIHVTITGINDQPVIESVGHLSIEDTRLGSTGKVTTTDPDAGDVGSNEAGEGSEQNLSYAVSAVEGSGITLTPKDGQTMGAPGTYTLTKDGTDWGEFTLNKDSSYSFKPSAEAEKLLAGENANFNLTITVDDGSDAPNSSTEENLHITITGTNEAPVINGGELTLEATEDTAITVGGKLDVSDDRVNEGNLSYSVAAGEGAAATPAIWLPGSTVTVPFSSMRTVPTAISSTTRCRQYRNWEKTASPWRRPSPSSSRTRTVRRWQRPSPSPSTAPTMLLCFRWIRRYEPSGGQHRRGRRHSLRHRRIRRYAELCPEGWDALGRNGRICLQDRLRYASLSTR